MAEHLKHGPPFVATLTTLERALDLEDILWVQEVGGNDRAFRHHRRSVIHQAVAALRTNVALTMFSWRRSAEARQNYAGPDPLIWMAKVRCLLWAVELLATWSITLGLPRPARAAQVLSQLRLELEPLRSIALAQQA